MACSTRLELGLSTSHAGYHAPVDGSYASYGLAVLAAASNAASNVLQRKANRDEPAELSMRPRLILELLHRRTWLAGFGTVVLSFVLMAAALGLGRLAAVQPIVVMELPITLIAASKVLGAHLETREWLASAAMTAGLAGLIAFLSPAAGDKGAAPGADWAVAGALTVAAIAVVVAAGLRSSEGRRAALLGAGTGMTFGLTAALMKGMTATFHHGLAGVLTAWQTYAMIAAGLLGMFLMQNALHAGRLIVAQPGITLADPAVAIVWGVVVFHESTNGGLDLLGAIVSAAVMVAGVVVLARSPVLQDEGAAGEDAVAPNDRDGARTLLA